MIVVVAAVGEAEGAGAAAAALACAGAEADSAALLVEVGGGPARPTLVSTAAAQRLEERLAAHLDGSRPAARGRIVRLAVSADEQGLEAAAAAATVARGAVRGGGEATVALHLPAPLLQPLLGSPAGRRVGAAMLRADLAADRHLLALAVRDLRRRGLAAGVLKRRLGWVAERRALFGALPAAEAARLLPRPLVPRGAESGSPVGGGGG